MTIYLTVGMKFIFHTLELILFIYCFLDACELLRCPVNCQTGGLSSSSSAFGHDLPRAQYFWLIDKVVIMYILWMFGSWFCSKNADTTTHPVQVENATTHPVHVEYETLIASLEEQVRFMHELQHKICCRLEEAIAEKKSSLSSNEKLIDELVSNNGLLNEKLERNKDLSTKTTELENQHRSKMATLNDTIEMLTQRHALLQAQYNESEEHKSLLKKSYDTLQERYDGLRKYYDALQEECAQIISKFATQCNCAVGKSINRP